MTTLRLNTPLDDVETQMRRALRVGTSNPGNAAREQGHDSRASRRFAQSGDVPVTRLNARKDNPLVAALAAAEETLQSERSLREQAEAALAQATSTITALQTKLAHTEIAYAEALAAERDRLEAGQHLSGDQPQPAAAESQPMDVTPPADDDEPVQWWVPGWKGDYRAR